MSRQQLPERMEQERESLLALAEQSSIFSFSECSDASSVFRLLFQGRGYCWSDRVNGCIERVEEHPVRLKLPETYPESPPVVEWETAAIHPSWDADDVLAWKDLQVNWDPKMNLDLICERIWDLLRGAEEVDLRNWEHCVAGQEGGEAAWRLPADARQLRDRASSRMTNVIHYRRKNANPLPPKLDSTVEKDPAPCPPESLQGWESGIQFVEEAQAEKNRSDRDEQIWFLDE